MQRLVDVTRVVNEQTKSKGVLVILRGERLGNLLVVRAVLVATLSGENIGHGSHCTDTGFVPHVEVGEIIPRSTRITEDRSIDEVPR